MSTSAGTAAALKATVFSAQLPTEREKPIEKLHDDDDDDDDGDTGLLDGRAC